MEHISSGSSTFGVKTGTCLDVGALGDEVACELRVLVRIAQRPDRRSWEQSLALLYHLPHK